MTKSFHLSDILSITHDRLFSTRHMEGVYDICNFLTQDNPFTHQLPRVHDECTAWLLGLHPTLNNLPKLTDADVDRMKGRGADWWKPWLNEQIAKYGEYLDVTPIPKGIHEYRNPLVEAIELVGKDKVIVVETDGKD